MNCKNSSNNAAGKGKSDGCSMLFQQTITNISVAFENGKDVMDVDGINTIDIIDNPISCTKCNQALSISNNNGKLKLSCSYCGKSIKTNIDVDTNDGTRQIYGVADNRLKLVGFHPLVREITTTNFVTGNQKTKKIVINMNDL